MVEKRPSDTLMNGLPTLDVRTPKEFAQGHTPSALSFPLFTDLERHEVGTKYKQVGRDEAVLLGLEFVGPKLDNYVKEALKLAPEKKVNMYCWRGGMRSGSMAWLLRSAGFEVNLIEGGYKAWRTQVGELLSSPLKLINLGGLTGTGKTDVLKELSAQGEQVLDLEELAKHTGSAFNAFEEEQPTTETFENELAASLLQMDMTQPIWVEDESRNIGKVFLHNAFFASKDTAPFVLVNRSKEERVKAICELYGDVPKEELIASFKKIERRIGGQYLKAAIQNIEDGDLPSAARIALRYYDKAYMHSMGKKDRKPVFSLSLTGKTATEAAKALQAWRQKTNL